MGVAPAPPSGPISVSELHLEPPGPRILGHQEHGARSSSWTSSRGGAAGEDKAAMGWGRAGQSGAPRRDGLSEQRPPCLGPLCITPSGKGRGAQDHRKRGRRLRSASEL